MDGQQFRGCRQIPLFRVVEAMEVVQAALVVVEKLGRAEHLVAVEEFGEIDRVRLYRECRTIGRLAVGSIKAEGVVEGVRRVIEDQHIIGEIQVVIVIAPFAADMLAPCFGYLAPGNDGSVLLKAICPA